MICSDSVAKTFFKSQSVIGNKILSAEFNRAAVCSSKVLPDLISYYMRRILFASKNKRN